MPTCLTIAPSTEHEILLNHHLYCKHYGYQHISIDSSTLSNEQMKGIWKYHALYQHLLQIPDNDIIAMVNQHAAFFNPISLEDLMGVWLRGEERSFFAVDNSSEHPIEPSTYPAQGRSMQTNLIVVRNNAEGRNNLFNLILHLHDHILADGRFLTRESEVLRSFCQHPCEETIVGHYPNLSVYVNWDALPCFVVNTGEQYLSGAPWSIVQNTLHSINRSRAAVHAINQTWLTSQHVHDFDEYLPLSEDKFSGYNTHGCIAFVILYTPNIASSGKVAEHNFKRYCDRHGYALYVYRDKPTDITDNIFGNWLKPWVLKAHISQHDWVFWIDADVLVVNPLQKIEPLLKDRDLILAKDMAGWHFNSGVMGFRHTRANIQLLDAIWERFTQVEDKTYTYASQGDQHHIINVIREHGLINENNIVDALTINTPPAMQTEHSFMVHYMGEGEPMRTKHMMYDDEKSIRRLKQNYAAHKYNKDYADLIYRQR